MRDRRLAETSCGRCGKTFFAFVGKLDFCPKCRKPVYLVKVPAAM